MIIQSEPVASNCGPLLGTGSDDGRSLRLQIFDLVRATGPVSRARIAKRLGISPGTVSTLTADLISQGVLHEAGMKRARLDTARGRPPVGLAVRPEAFMAAGIKLSRLDGTALLVDFAGNPLASHHMAFGDVGRTADALIDAIGTMLDTMLSEIGRTRTDLAAVGVGLPGFVHHATGRVHWSILIEDGPIDFAKRASDRLGVDVTIDNDANLVALAELWFGKGRDTADFVVVTTEEGVGVGAVVGHRLFRGANGFGPELGHIKVQLDGALCRCGQRGCLEAYLSDYAMAREALAALNIRPDAIPAIPDLIDVLSAEAQRGAPAARSIFTRSARYLAVGLATVVNLFDPSLLILSGGRMRYDWLDLDRLRDEMRSLVIDTGRGLPPLVVHEWGNLLWAHGAAALALSCVTEARIGSARDIVT